MRLEDTETPNQETHPAPVSENPLHFHLIPSQSPDFRSSLKRIYLTGFCGGDSRTLSFVLRTFKDNWNKIK